MKNEFFLDTMQGLLEAIAIDKGIISTVEVDNMPNKTLRTSQPNLELKEQTDGIKMTSIAKKSTTWGFEPYLRTNSICTDYGWYDPDNDTRDYKKDE